MTLKQLYNFDDIYQITTKKSKIVALMCLLCVVFLALAVLTVYFLHSQTLLCVAVCFVVLALGYFVVFVVVKIKHDRLQCYLRFLADLQSGLRKESSCQVVGICPQKVTFKQLQMQVVVVSQQGKQRNLLVESSIDVSFDVGAKYQVQTVGDCLVAVGIYES